jgi:sulfide:quinone oxidoreductase
MDIHLITSELAVSAQITPADLQEINQLGYHTIICNRPDGEEPGQPGVESLAHAAETLGMKLIYQPIFHCDLNLSDGRQFAQYIQEADSPVFAYCRTGTRSAILWALGQHGHLSCEQIRKQTLNAGYNLDEMYIEKL